MDDTLSVGTVTLQDLPAMYEIRGHLGGEEPKEQRIQMRGGQIQVTPLLAATILGWVGLGITDIVLAIKDAVIPNQLHGYVCSILATTTVTGVMATMLNRRAAQTPQQTSDADAADQDETAAIVRAVEVGRRLERREHAAGSNVHALRND